MISGQGYSVDLPDHDPRLDTNTHVKLGDRGYAYAEIRPGKHRIVAFSDFGCHDEAFIDPERVDHLKQIYEEDFKVVSTETGANKDNWRNLRTCLRPQSVDDLPMLGPMSYFPNVILNAGHGGHGTSYCFACAKIV